MRNDWLIARKKKNEVFTTTTTKLFKLRWAACEKVQLQDTTSQTALKIGNSIPVISIKDQQDNTYYKVVMNTLHDHKNHKGSCTCMLWQEHFFPCKHAMFIIKHPCGCNAENAKKYIVEKELCDKRFLQANYLDMFNRMKLDGCSIPDTEQVANLARESHSLKAPACIAKDESAKDCKCGFCDGKIKVKRPGRKRSKRLYSRDKGPNYC